MSVRDELRRAAVGRFFETRDELADPRLGLLLADAARDLVAAWHAAPLVEYAELLGEAVTAAPVIDAVVAERQDRFRAEVAELVNSVVDELVEEIMALRRELVLVSARVAALEPAAFDPAEPDLVDDEPDLEAA